jgi:ABC-type Zn2+ transport system substrate-binding protein/surface adhesin
MRCIPMTLAITLISSFALAEQRHASSHVHGLNHATVVLEGNNLQISYEFPAEQLSEYDEHKHDEHKHDEHKHDEHKHDEHKHDEHKHDEQGDKNLALSEKLEAIDSVFAMVRLPKNAQCKETKVTHSVTQVASNDKEHASHYDALIESTLECSAPNNLTNISFEPAFERFDDLEKIEVEGLLGTRALSETLTVTSSSLAL